MTEVKLPFSMPDRRITDPSVVLCIDVRGCQRCGGNHPAVKFKNLSRPSDRFTSWAMCPTLNEPIMLSFGGGSQAPSVETMELYIQNGLAVTDRQTSVAAASAVAPDEIPSEPRPAPPELKERLCDGVPSGPPDAEPRPAPELTLPQGEPGVVLPPAKRRVIPAVR